MASQTSAASTAVLRNDTKSCKLCKHLDTDEMVQCDNCDKWFHFNCVGVTQAIQSQPWICASCQTKSSLLEKSHHSQSSSRNNDMTSDQQLESRHRSNPSNIPIGTNVARDILQKNPANSLNTTNVQFECPLGNPASTNYVSPNNIFFGNPANQVDNQRPDHANSVRSNKASSKRSNETQRRLRIRMLEEEREMQLKILVQKERLEKDFIAKKYEIMSMEDSNDEDLSQADINVSRTKRWVQETNNQIPENWSPIGKFRVLENPFNNFPTNIKQEDQHLRNQAPPAQHHLNSQQIAARHAVTKDLPIFTGKPEEWPLFISSFENSTLTCGFSHAENLMRLQKSLKGRALEAVRSRLLLPHCVPQVIDTLRMLFGRPEIIIQSLLQKIRAEPAPKPDKLEGLINYSLAVQNLSSTIEATGLMAHLENPLLLQELIDKLPTQIKLNWAMTKQTIPGANISHFSNWLSNIAQMACEVTVPNYTQFGENNQQKRHKEFTGAHSSTQNFSVEAQKSSKSSLNKENKRLRKCLICAGECSKVQECDRFKKLEYSKKWDEVKKNRLCRKCLSAHKQYYCKSQATCGINGCEFKHHPLLHNPNSPDPSTSKTCNIHQRSTHDPIFRILPIKLFGNDTEIDTFAFLDEGSSVTLLEDELANHLKLSGTAEPLCLKWTANTVREEKHSKRVSLGISGVNDNSKRFQMCDVRTVSKLCLPSQSLDFENLVKVHPHLKGLPVTSYKRATPRILIGLDNWRLGIPLQIYEGTSKQPVASKTRIGWTIHGLFAKNNIDTNHSINLHDVTICNCGQDATLNQLVKDFFSLENFGVKTPEGIFESKDDKHARSILEKTTKKIGDRFESGLLWKQQDIVLPDNFNMAKRRLECLKRKLNADPKLKDKMDSQIQQHVIKGYARKLSTEELRKHSPKIWYLPIFPVTKSNKPDKIRIVFDAAAQMNGVSLNSYLHKGPDELVPLPFVLSKFRERPVAIGGDIKEMYHQVVIRKEDQDSQRFIWPNPEKSDQIDVYVMQVMTFGATCSPSTAQYVKNLNAKEWSDKYPRAASAIINQHYVDDYLDSVSTESEAIKLAKEVDFIHRKAGFEMRNWTSNSSAVRAVLNASPDCSEIKDLNEQLKNTKVLGMIWEPTTDTFTFSFRNRNSIEQVLIKDRPTKREILRITMSIFDPLGLLSSYMVYVKILLQEIWRSKINWDDNITIDQLEKWQRWICLLPSIEEVHVPRCYSRRWTYSDKINVQLHVFMDASEDAYAAVVYLRVADENGVDCSLVIAKSKVAPLKPLSIPRMELQAAVLGSRLLKSASKMLSVPVDQKFLWTDSKTVLYWLEIDPKRFKQFVALRIGEILTSTDTNNWHWVPSELNVADEATKWRRVPNLKTDGRWFSGPSFLYEPESLWPKSNSTNNDAYDLADEIKTSLIHFTRTSNAIIDFYRFSKWNRMIRALAYVFRFIKNTKAKTRHKDITIGPLTSDELELAAIQLYKIAQSQGYPKEVSQLSNNDPLDKSSSLYSRSAYLDEQGILRIKGRIDAANVCYDIKRPIILPRDHHITKLIVDHYHRSCRHLNQETVVNEIRQKYAIPRLRVLVKSAKKFCQQCKNRETKPEPPEMAQLPRARLSSFIQPFSYVGVDYFGPMNVRVCRRTEKRWGVLLTCLTVRAIHIEIAHSLSADSCIMALRNFMARRGQPVEFFSDNGTNFVGANNELQKALKEMDSEKIQETLTTTTTKWNFIPPSSPHMGGSWERMVGSVKKILNEVLTTRTPSDEVLRNLLAEIENIVNSRPLTYVPLENFDDEALTPNHLLLGSSNGIKVPGKFVNQDLLLRKQWRVSQQLTNEFWHKWMREYLPTLTRRSKWFSKAKPIEKGDVVLIVDESNPRNTWPKGIVEEVFLSKDGQARKVIVRTSHGFLTRPAVKLAVLDVKSKDGKSTPLVELPEGSVAASVITVAGA